jgi:hypothetical protein
MRTFSERFVCNRLAGLHVISMEMNGILMNLLFHGSMHMHSHVTF